MAGAITTLGLGSGLELQSILDQLKEADSSSIRVKETQKTKLQEKIDAYNGVNAKLFNVKSDALSLSLESDFLKTSVSVSDEEIASATANDGIAATNFSLDVTQKASYNSFQSVGVEEKTSVMHEEPATTITDLDASVATGGETMDILYGAPGAEKTISVSLTADQTLTQIADAINESDANKDANGNSLVSATVEKNSQDQYYIRLSAVAGGDSLDENLTVEGFDYVEADVTFSVTRGANEEEWDENRMYLSLRPGATYEETVAIINDAGDNPGVTAAIIDTGDKTDPFRLTLTSDATGEENRIKIERLPLTEVNGAEEGSLNAKFTVNGISYQRQSNDGINDVVSGVTFNLKKIGETNIGIQKNTEAVKENILSLIENYNELINTIKGQDTDATDDSSGETSNPFEGDYAIKSLSYQLQTLFTSSVDVDSVYKGLADVGLEVNRDGTLKMDEDTLDQALASSPDAVTNLFIGNSTAGISGIGDMINDGISNMISSSGIVTTEISEAELKMTRLDEDIVTATERLDKQYETMAESFTRLDSYIRQLNSQSAYMESMIESFNKTTE